LFVTNVLILLFVLVTETVLKLSGYCVRIHLGTACVMRIRNYVCM